MLAFLWKWKVFKTFSFFFLFEWSVKILYVDWKLILKELYWDFANHAHVQYNIYRFVRCGHFFRTFHIIYLRRNSWQEKLLILKVFLTGRAPGWGSRSPPSFVSLLPGHGAMLYLCVIVILPILVAAPDVCRSWPRGPAVYVRRVYALNRVGVRSFFKP